MITEQILWSFHHILHLFIYADFNHIHIAQKCDANIVFFLAQGCYIIQDYVYMSFFPQKYFFQLDVTPERASSAFETLMQLSPVLGRKYMTNPKGLLFI